MYRINHGDLLFLGRRHVALFTYLIISAVFVQPYLLSEKEAGVYRSSYVEEEEYFIDKKIVCSGLEKIILKVMSILQCLHRCLSRESCDIINYRHGDGERPGLGECVIYDVPEDFQVSNEDCQLLAHKGWVALLPKASLKQRY